MYVNYVPSVKRPVRHIKGMRASLVHIAVSIYYHLVASLVAGQSWAKENGNASSSVEVRIEAPNKCGERIAHCPSGKVQNMTASSCP